MRTVEWDYGRACLRLIDQRQLPGDLAYTYCEDYWQVAQAIREMVVRGAPAIGVSAAFGLALAAQRSESNDLIGLQNDLKQAANILRAASPTAVNLEWCLQLILVMADGWQGDAASLRYAVLSAAQRIADQDVEINRRMARFGAALIEDGDTIIHHCNTGALAAVEWGTALGVVRMAYDMGKRIFVLVDETRPRLQGSRLTAWELEQYGIPYAIICDSASGYFLRSGQAQMVLFGADRVAANGDVANKIGTYMLALAARDNSVPVYAVVPTSTIDLSLANGEHIVIEERGQEEVLNLQINGSRVAPDQAVARNPAFDVTPHHLLNAIITENGIVYPPFLDNLPRAFSDQ